MQLVLWQPEPRVQVLQRSNTWGLVSSTMVSIGSANKQQVHERQLESSVVATKSASIRTPKIAQGGELVSCSTSGPSPESWQCDTVNPCTFGCQAALQRQDWRNTALSNQTSRIKKPNLDAVKTERGWEEDEDCDCIVNIDKC